MSTLIWSDKLYEVVRILKREPQNKDDLFHLLSDTEQQTVLRVLSSTGTREEKLDYWRG